MDRGLARALTFSAALAGACGGAPALARGQTIEVAPAVIRMATFGGGGRVRVSGAVEAAAQVIVAIRGSETEEDFNRKGRVGPIWVNSGKLTISRVPSLFLAFSSAPQAAILTPAALQQAGLDEGGLTSRMVVRPPAADRPAVRREYVGLKTAEGSYRWDEGAVQVEAPAGGRRRYALDLDWPTTARPGVYTATVYECRDGGIAGTASTRFEVAEAGVAAFMRGLAERRGGLYGSLAVAVMMLLGFSIDALVARLRRARARRPPPGAASSAQHGVRVH
jgi:hypothetical protein